MSKYYRIINKTGGYTWIQTCATLICSNNANSNSKTSGISSTNSNDDQDQSIISVNYVIRYVKKFKINQLVIYLFIHFFLTFNFRFI